MTITFRTYLTETGAVFATETFNSNYDAVEEFFAGESTLDIKVLGDFGEREDDAVAIRCMMEDIKQENSYTYKLLFNAVAAETVVELKVQMLKYMLERYFPCVRNYNKNFNNADYIQYASYYYEERFLAFKYLLPYALVQKCSEKMPGDTYLDLSKLSADELATYVIPQYYNELGAWDRESIRNDKDLMEFLSITWFMQAKYGRLD